MRLDMLTKMSKGRAQSMDGREQTHMENESGSEMQAFPLRGPSLLSREVELHLRLRCFLVCVSSSAFLRCCSASLEVEFCKYRSFSTSAKDVVTIGSEFAAKVTIFLPFGALLPLNP
ncbi:hypothetical protein KFK09_027366 [Dendrobium nobile]|uniref:Uncharacterized protein n=1 Tax=Dendrobium nobile TaxID=94219 RepID=A0A8T3AA96_DENNO|nr:hypothetical protein KFK09_027366 [Dendrobium nobile]